MTEHKKTATFIALEGVLTVLRFKGKVFFSSTELEDAFKKT